MLPRRFGRYWFWVAFPIGLAAAFVFSWWMGLLAFWVLSIAPHLLFGLYRRLNRRN